MFENPFEVGPLLQTKPHGNGSNHLSPRRDHKSVVPCIYHLNVLKNNWFDPPQRIIGGEIWDVVNKCK